jgi:hypothetical protein
VPLTHVVRPSVVFLIAFFHRVAPGVVAKDLMRAFDATGSIVGLLSGPTSMRTPVPCLVRRPSPPFTECWRSC